MAMRVVALSTTLALAMLLAACGNGGPDTDPKPQASPRGEPVGQPVTVTIGSGGGELSSADGRLKVVFPPGALATDTEVGLQSLTNTAPHGRGPAYRLTPEDLQVVEPLVLLLEDLPAGHGIAWQDSQNVWRALPHSPPGAGGAAGSEAAGMPTGTAGDFAGFEAFRLVPAEADLMPGQRQVLTVETCVRVNVDHLADLLPTCRPLTLAPLIKEPSVNAVVGGTVETGTVELEPGQARLIYSAPAAQPAANPVAVSVRISMLSPGLNLLVSNLNIAGPTRTYQLVQFDGSDLPSDWLPREPWNNPERVTGGRLVLNEHGTYSLRLEWEEDRGQGQTLAQFMQDAGTYESRPDGRIGFTSLGGDTFEATASAGTVTVTGYTLYTSNTSVVGELTFRD